ncbi:MAG: LamG domain-containing protein, partial [Verrucomicrobia bacterium]|nr:LamG domain-containing protein [Verrucomicrobiota bacterium]
ADVLVLEGAVEAEPHDGLEQEALVLHENQSRRFTASGISEITDSESKFARFNQPLSLERFAPPPSYVHWSFDETEGGRFESTAVGTAQMANPAEVFDVAPGAQSRVHSKGHLNGALYFDGRHRAMASFPGLSANGPRTVAFWVKTPSDTQLSEAYAMAAWIPSNDQLRFRPVHICWNRNPSEGALGVLRVDYARGFALGTTPLRNGRWHHVAVVFVPGSEACTPLQVKLYLDGRFEGEGRPSPPGIRADSTKSPEDYTKAVQDNLWLGCRLGSDGPRADRFRGAMDELFVVDRELVPSEIVQLMTRNRIDPAQIVEDRSSPLDQLCLKEPGSAEPNRL